MPSYSLRESLHELPDPLVGQVEIALDLAVGRDALDQI
jgi:hypothetical protein